jgi:hypothetical protein
LMQCVLLKPRKGPLAGLFWEKSTAGWWLISQMNRLLVSFTANHLKVCEAEMETDSCRLRLVSAVTDEAILA